MVCPYLEYRSEGGGDSFDSARPYCTAASQFVEPMRADICNDRFGLKHEKHCEIFRAADQGESETAPPSEHETDGTET